ncbi:hypothetical protein KVT40_007239 [Elsinoe batatas]|uniref:N-alpha-acetyltransferase 40 n=1 Tax=Elsinoe batatas TaxID=2601811 RepID=A0A8K0KZK7_9PEZI|nr:hypothetical protein KVT40_007239 [Elsinoe batatas]
MKRKRDDIDMIKSVNKLTPTEFKQAHFPSHLDIPKASAEPDKSRRSWAAELFVSPAAIKVADADDRLSDPDLEACLALVEETSSKDYAASAMGWHKGRKRREMRDRDMRYLIVRDSTPEGDQTRGGTASVAGFLSFMLTHEDGLPVIYVYEVHLKPSIRKSGVGKQLMNLVEHIGASVGVDKSMLTVFRSNDKAVKWYERLGYTVDEYSPPDKKLRGDKVKQADYLILSKTLSTLTRNAEFDYAKHTGNGGC